MANIYVLRNVFIIYTPENKGKKCHKNGKKYAHS